MQADNELARARQRIRALVVLVALLLLLLAILSIRQFAPDFRATSVGAPSEYVLVSWETSVPDAALDARIREAIRGINWAHSVCDLAQRIVIVGNPRSRRAQFREALRRLEALEASGNDLRFVLVQTISGAPFESRPPRAQSCGQTVATM
jgi:hypothetical protein